MTLNESMIFDTHAHYDDEAFETDRKEVLNFLKNNNVCGIINAGTNINKSIINIIPNDLINPIEKTPTIKATILTIIIEISIAFSLINFFKFFFFILYLL